MKTRWIAAVFAVVVLGACATVPPSQQDEKIYQVIDLFNTAAADEFVKQAGVPFLFGEQVLYTESDVAAVLARARASGLIIAPLVVDSVDVGPPPADARFAVEVFYERLPEDARLVVTESTAGDLTLIFGGEANRLPKLLGLVRGRP